MGYRSNLSAIIYGPKDKISALVMKERHLAPGYNIFGSESMFAPHIAEWDAPADTTHSGLSFVMLNGEDWKWYDGYAEVDAWMRFMRSAPDVGCAFEFIRVGEEDTDVEVERVGSEDQEGGQEVQWLLTVGSHISCEVGPPYDPDTTVSTPCAAPTESVRDPDVPAEPYWGKDEVEAAMCLWEAFLELQAQDEPKAKALAELDGVVHARNVVMGWAHECCKAWDASVANDTALDPFDWEHCPNFLVRKLTQWDAGREGS